MKLNDATSIAILVVAVIAANFAAEWLRGAIADARKD